MPVEKVEGLPDFDPNADRGDNFTPTTDEIELTAEELAVAKGDKVEDAGGKAQAEDKVDAKAEDKVEDKVEDKPRDDKGKFIPKARFDEVNNKAKARVRELEETIAQLKQRLAPPEGEEAPDVTKLEEQLETKGDEYGKLLADGDLDKAKAVLREINKINRQLGVIEATRQANSQTEEMQHVTTLSGLVEMYKEMYPVFDETKKDVYDQELVNYVGRLQGAFEVAGQSPAAALREAVELTVAKFGLVGPDEPVVEVAPSKTKADERKAEGVRKAVAAAAKQPKTLDKVGVDSDKAGMSKIDVFSLSQEEFSRLPESTLARLRGDFM